MIDHSSTGVARRRFLSGTLLGGTVMAAGSVSSGSESLEKSFSESLRFHIGDGVARRLAIGPDDSVCVLAGNEVRRFDHEGKALGSINLPRPGRCIALRNGWVYVGIRNAIHRYSERGELVDSLPTIEGGLLGDLAFDSSGLVATDIKSKRLLRLDETQAEPEWKAIAEGIHEASRLSRLASGGWVLAEPHRHRVSVLSESGRTLQTWGKRTRGGDGFQGCCNPMAIAQTVDGDFVTVEAGQLRLKRFDRTGAFVSEIAGPDSMKTHAILPEEDALLGCAAGGVDVAVGRNGDVYLLHAAAAEVVGFSLA